MKKNTPIIALLAIVFVMSSCSVKKTVQHSSLTPTKYVFPYDLEQPDVTFELPKSLDEVSGICFTPNNKEIVAVQDEDGILFFIDKNTGELLREEPFHDHGDYEDLVVVGDQTFVIKSSGSLYQLERNADNTYKRTKYKVSKNKEHDFEGLCYDAKNQILLLACKEELSKDDSFCNYKGILGFDLKKKELIEKPVVWFSLEKIHSYIAEKGTPEMHDEFHKILATNDGRIQFAPSAVAIHPITDHIYILSSKGKTLGIVNRENEIVHLEKLDKSIHRQPEGMVFDKDGTLYISNEAKDGVAKIYRFRF